MSKLTDWCSVATQNIKSSELTIYTGDSTKLPAGVAMLAKVVPGHYASSARRAHILKKLGKKKSAQYILGKLPTSKSLRSGDLGEIIAAVYVTAHTGFELAINRFRWKDHREMAMRGDDIIALAEPAKGKRLRFLKGEAKSRVNLVTGVVSEARSSLKKSGGRPSPHALAFLADRLFSQGKIELSDRIDIALYKSTIRLEEVEHLLFTFSGNDPTNFLKSDLQKYGGKIRQHAVGLRVAKHGEFVKAVYKKVVENAGDH